MHINLLYQFQFHCATANPSTCSLKVHEPLTLNTPICEEVHAHYCYVCILGVILGHRFSSLFFFYTCLLLYLFFYTYIYVYIQYILMYSSRCYQPHEASRPRSAQPETLPDPWRGPMAHWRGQKPFMVTPMSCPIWGSLLLLPLNQVFV